MLCGLFQVFCPIDSYGGRQEEVVWIDGVGSGGGSGLQTCKLDTDVPGVYFIRYDFMVMSSGRSGQVTRTVVVHPRCTESERLCSAPSNDTTVAQCSVGGVCLTELGYYQLPTAQVDEDAAPLLELTLLGASVVEVQQVWPLPHTLSSSAM
jgi:hypothetical protein